MVVDGLAYLSGNTIFFIVNVSVPSNPIFISQYQDVGLDANGLFVKGG